MITRTNNTERTTLTGKCFATKLNTDINRKSLDNMTNKEWQQLFFIMKIKSVRTNNKKLTRRNTNSVISQRRWSLSRGNGDGCDTLDMKYCNFINSVLGVIRNKEVDYVYHTYQIEELLRFCPNLNSKLIHNDEITYFEVWLDR